MQNTSEQDRATAPPIAPLAGIRVVDFSQNLAGPYSTQILGDLGADVLKVEPPNGDPARRWGPPFIGGQSPLFQAANRNKRSVVLDLKSDSGQRAARELGQSADVVVQALRRGVAERLGIGYDDLRAENPTLIYVSVTAYGTEGPLVNDPGYDPLMQARSGLMEMTGDRDGAPARTGTSLVDMGTGMWVALAVMAALMERAKSKKGCHITASLLDSALAWMAYNLTSHLCAGSSPERMGSSIAVIAPYQSFPCRDGNVMIAVGNDRIFRRLCLALSLDLADKPEFAENAARVQNREWLVELISGRTSALDVQALLDVMREHSVPAAPVQSVAEAATDPQTLATGMLRACEHEKVANYVDIPLPIRWDGERMPLRRLPPELGADQKEVFNE